MFLQSVFANMDKILENKTPKKLFLYFSHDINIVHVLRTLNLVDTIKPGFGAYVNFELYSNGRIKVNMKFIIQNCLPLNKKSVNAIIKANKLLKL